MMKTVFYHWLPVGIWAWAIFYFSSLPDLNSGLGILDLILRKAAHIIEYGVLTALIIRAVGRTWRQWPWRRIALWSGGGAILYAVSDEIHQSFVPRRGPSATDVLIDSVGIAVSIYFYRKFILSR
jgi:VanZ family protein